ncbi:YncE family protein [Amycolatopsis anabasis]|uniref:YncE family protein n=1 Tax=Amycolatopsis anabasis TaxID=1840409 RepID=UPI0015D0D4AE|nr:YncE family protein [Amycolatopsis anabasis]
MRGPIFPRRALFVLFTALVAGAIGVLPPASAAQVVNVRVGDRPGPIGVNSATGMVYVANTAAGTVSVVDGRKNAVTATVPVGEGPSAVAVNQFTNRVYVALPAAGTVAVLDGASNTVAGTVAAGPGTAVLGVDESVNQIYAGSKDGGAVGVIDGVSSTLTATIPGPGSGFSGVRVDPGRRLAYFSSVNTDTVEVLDANAKKFVASIKVGKAPAGLDLHRTSNTIYVANAGIHHLSVVDGWTRTERKTVLLRSEASSAAVYQRTNTVYANGGPNGIVKIDGAKGELAGELSLGINPGEVAVHQRTGAVYVTDPLHDLVSVITGF